VAAMHRANRKDLARLKALLEKTALLEKPA
jgi:hypothetical protein